MMDQTAGSGSRDERSPFEDFGRYLLLETVGKGGAGQVELALGRGADDKPLLVAIKRLKTEVDERPDLHKMLLREAAVVARLVHPNVVVVHGIERSGEEIGIVMEYLDGRARGARAEKHTASGTRMPVGVALGIARQALTGLHHAHELKDDAGRSLELVHRDFTPHNVFLTRDGTVKVLDFGIAKIAGALTRTATGLVKGKLGYMAPEQILATTADRRVDVFAAGVVLWEMMAGRPIGRASSIIEVLEKATEPLPRLREAAPWVDAELAAIVDRAITVDAGARHATAAALRDDLDAYARRQGFHGTAFEVAAHLESVLGRDMRAREEGVRDVYPLAVKHLPETPHDPQPAPPLPLAPPSPDGSGELLPPPRPHSWAVWVAAFVVAVVAAGLFVMFSRSCASAE
jgi:serine/threonine-protein kinase